VIAEGRIAYFPKLQVEGDLTTEEYGMLVTTQRLIFVITKKAYMTTVGMLYDNWKNPKGPVDIATIDLNQLSTMKHNFGIWNTQLVRFFMKKKLLCYRLEIYYKNQYGSVKKVKSDLLVPSDFYSDLRKEGKSGKEIDKEYASLVRDALLKAASPQVAAASEWAVSPEEGMTRGGNAMDSFLKRKESSVATGDGNKSSEERKMVLTTNAPLDWPSAEILPFNLDESIQSGMESVLLLGLAGNLKGKFEASGKTVRFERLNKHILFDDGILSVDFTIRDQDRLYDVFFYPLPTNQASSHFAGVRALLESRKESTPIYYSTGPLQEETPSNPLFQFNPWFLSKKEGPIPEGIYAMWKASEEDPRFASSKTNHYLGRIYAALDSIETYVLSDLLNRFGLVSEKGGRVALPNEMSLPIEGPDDQVMIFTASKEKGIRFHFNTSLTDLKYREMFLKNFAVFTETFRSIADERKWPKDPVGDYRPSGWFSATQRVMFQQEKEGVDVDIVGQLLFHEVPNSPLKPQNKS
jgi:hypothetical protein